MYKFVLSNACWCNPYSIVTQIRVQVQLVDRKPEVCVQKLFFSISALSCFEGKSNERKDDGLVCVKRKLQVSRGSGC